jgi:hypothetical protein
MLAVLERGRKRPERIGMCMDVTGRGLANPSKESIHFEGVHQFAGSPFLPRTVQHWAQGLKPEQKMLHYTALTHFDVHLALGRHLANPSKELVHVKEVCCFLALISTGPRASNWDQTCSGTLL